MVVRQLDRMLVSQYGSSAVQQRQTLASWTIQLCPVAYTGSAVYLWIGVWSRGGQEWTLDLE
jgi:hypothetical protein